MNQFCVVLPVYNNPDSYLAVIQSITATGYPLIVVDDGSTTPVTVPEGVHLIVHPKNRGKGVAITTGGEKARTLGYSHFAVMDADGQHYARDLGRFAPFTENNLLTIGVRDLSGDHVPSSSRFGCRFSNFWVKIETGRTLKDTQSGFRLYPVSVLDLPLRASRYDYEIEVLVQHLWHHGAVAEVAIDTHYPPQDERVSHFDKWHDNRRLSMLHTRLTLQRWLLLKGRF
jgi:glycosyltransferase involved in cell wall biosynthesis